MSVTLKFLPFVLLFGIKFDTLLALPVITPEESEHIIKAEDDFKLACKSDVNITWSYTEVLKQLKMTVSNIDVRWSREGDIYVAELAITNASGLNVGFYFCHETENPKEVTSLHLYVDDDKTLCTNPFLWTPVYVVPFQPVVLPCKPTHPSVEVNLYAGDGIEVELKMRLIETGTEDSEWTYDPTIGFTSTNTTRYLVSVYTCFFRKIGVTKHTLLVGIALAENSKAPTNNPTTTSCRQRCEQIIWKIRVTSFPIWANVKWFDSRGKQIQNDQKFTIKNTIWESILIIRNATVDDRGNFTVEARNEFQNENVTFLLEVTDKPTVTIKKDQFHLVDITETVKCIVSGFPKPEIKWEFKRCIDDSCGYTPLISSEIVNHMVYTSSAAVRSNQSGYIKCIANNIEGTYEQITDYTVTDVKKGFEVFITEDDIKFPTRDYDNLQLAAGSQVQFECFASIQNYSSHITWYFNYATLYEQNRTVKTEPCYRFNHSSLYNHDVARLTCKTQFSVNSSVIIRKMGDDHAGVYVCATMTIPQGKVESSEIIIGVVEPQKPRITVTNMDGKIYPTTDNFTCFYEATPRASIKWYKDGFELFPDNTTIKFEKMKQVLVFIKPNYTTDEGEYTCRVKNRLGFVSKTATLKFANRPRVNTPIHIAIGILLVLLIAIIVPLVYKIKRERQIKKILKEAGLADFEKGAVECINPNLGIDDQAQLLPYSKKSWEIPKEKIKLGKQLGAGAFGVVMEAIIERYDNNADLKVAVKMMKRNADDMFLVALLSELKIMVHLGKHLNVVNLIGACTKHIAKRELYVIVEFCQFGNLRNYLLHHRENFINQIDPGTEKIDYSIGADVLSRPVPVASDDSLAGPPNGIDDDKTNSIYVAETIVAISPDRSRGKKPTMTNIRIPLRAKSNCKRDYKGNVKPVCTKDLLIWAFQVSRGMEYLASRRVLHGDLASRNILLTENNIVKICDFGLARRMYKNHDYKKKGRGPLPIRWMSIESMRDKVFSTQSDVWSFGIVLWEFFSLARTPYPGMVVNERIFQKLIEGYRMDQPTYASKEIYSLMLNCWETEPLSRPTFQKLSDRIGSMLEESVTKFYIDLNDPYLVMNRKKTQSGQSDFLQMVSPPDFKAVSSFSHPHRTLNTAQYDCKPKRPRTLFTSSEP